eukprot:2798016-Amphidinium_carterae.1
MLQRSGSRTASAESNPTKTCCLSRPSEQSCSDIESLSLLDSVDWNLRVCVCALLTLLAQDCSFRQLQVKICNPRLCNDDLAKDMTRKHAASHIDVRCRRGGRDA